MALFGLAALAKGVLRAVWSLAPDFILIDSSQVLPVTDAMLVAAA